MIVSLPQRMLAEFLGTATLVMVIIGSGLMGQALSADLGVVILINQIATVLGLGVLVAVLLPISGAHINPAVTLMMTIRRSLPLTDALGYLAVQLLGGLAGVVAAQVMFGRPALEISDNSRVSPGSFLGEMIATAGLMGVILMAIAQHRSSWLPLLVPAWIGAAFFATSSTAFANPAVALGRMFTDSFTGITPGSAAGFIAAQLVGMLVALALLTLVTTREVITRE